MSQTSSQSLSRSVLTSEATVPGKEHPITPSAHVSPLPFLVCSLYGQPSDFLRFLPGAFRRQGTILGQGATFSVEKHTLKDIGRGIIDDLVHGDDHFTRWPVIAIKRLRSKHHIPWKSLEAIEREVIALKLLKGAENIVQLIGLGWEVAPVGGDSRLWPVLILEYAENGTLADLQSTSEPVSYELKRKLCVDVARGLLRLHRTGIAHGDLKSENILIFGAPGDKYVAKISDFGYAGLDYQEQDTASGKSSGHAFFIPGGTELWSAPEYGKPTSKIGFMKQDIYSWGLMVLRTMMDGRSPFLAHSSYSNRDGQNSLGPTILSIKKSGEKDRKRWVETCLNTRSCAEDISTNCQILLKVILPCLSLEPEVRNLASSMRIWE
jgi:serine/threonine protein kinase